MTVGATERTLTVGMRVFLLGDPGWEEQGQATPALLKGKRSPLQ